ncbi:hypothetical protein [Moorena producens]|uniref:hypothetical protein n=1 Tax=Moorena producens TaxID=1155739 RepID=UPI0013146F29|nr:hypothetical protein [Moorena producens]
MPLRQKSLHHQTSSQFQKTTLLDYYGGLHNYQVHRIVFLLPSSLFPLPKSLLPAPCSEVPKKPELCT